METLMMVGGEESPSTVQEYVAAYNEAQRLLGRDDVVNKFRDLPTAKWRLIRARDDLIAMHGFAVLARGAEDGKFTWITEKPSKTREEAERPARGGGRSALNLTAPLEIVSTSNPKRVGSRAHEHFELYLTHRPATGEAYIEIMKEAGSSRRMALDNLRWDVDHGYIRLGVEPPAEETTATEQPVETEMTEETSSQ